MQNCLPESTYLFSVPPSMQEGFHLEKLKKTDLSFACLDLATKELFLVKKNSRKPVKS
jgi:hypothetical protein